MRIMATLRASILLIGTFMASCVTTDLDRSTSDDSQDQATSSEDQATSTTQQAVFQRDDGGGTTCTTDCIYNCWSLFNFEPAALSYCQSVCCPA